MKNRVRNSLLVGAGFLAGSLGLKALTSPVAKRGCVKAMVQGMKVKAACLDMAEQAKAEYDDIVAEATYLAQTEGASVEPEVAAGDQGACACGCSAPSPTVA